MELSIRFYGLLDLDFFTAKEFYPETLFENLKLANATVIRRGKNSLTVEVAGVKLDLLRYAYPSLAASELIDGIDLISLPDLAEMKLNAISNRGSKKDFFDIAELLKSFTLPQMIGFFSEKYPMTDSFTVIRSLAWFEDAETEPDPISLNGSSWNQVKLRVSLAVAEL